MRRLTMVLTLLCGLVGGCGYRAAEAMPAGNTLLADVTTSPAGVADDAPAALPQKVLERAREFRGNPIPLAVLTGTVLLVALVLGVYTLCLVYRRPPDDHGQ
jgi:hypothetical protein